MNRRSFIKALVVLPFALRSLGSVQPRALKVAWRASRRPVKFKDRFSDMVTTTLKAHRGQVIENITRSNALFKMQQKREKR